MDYVTATVGFTGNLSLNTHFPIPPVRAHFPSTLHFHCYEVYHNVAEIVASHCTKMPNTQ